MDRQPNRPFDFLDAYVLAVQTVGDCTLSINKIPYGVSLTVQTHHSVYKDQSTLDVPFQTYTTDRSRVRKSFQAMLNDMRVRRDVLIGNIEGSDRLRIEDQTRWKARTFAVRWAHYLRRKGQYVSPERRQRIEDNIDCVLRGDTIPVDELMPSDI